MRCSRNVICVYKRTAVDAYTQRLSHFALGVVVKAYERAVAPAAPSLGEGSSTNRCNKNSSESFVTCVIETSLSRETPILTLMYRP